MALLHRAKLRPSKLQLLDGWASTQPWFEGDAAAGLSSVASGSGAEGTVVPGAAQLDAVVTRHDRDSTVIEGDALRLVVARVLRAPGRDAGALGDDASEVLTGTWTDQPEPTVLVLARLR
jgi:hypothetical protein